MIKDFCDFIKSNIKVELVMSVALLLSVTLIACNMNRVVEEKTKDQTEREIKFNGRVIVIDPGHGGTDPGKVGISGVKEKDVNLEIAVTLQHQLVNRGYKVVLTRSSDQSLSGEKFSKVGDLNGRCQIINDTYRTNEQCIMISIHQNSFTQQSVHGAQCFYYQRADNSKRLAEIIQKKLNEQINTEREKRAKPNDSYYMLINSKCPAVIIECGFLSNALEEQKLTNQNYQKKLSKIIAQGVDEFFNDKS